MTSDSLLTDTKKYKIYENGQLMSKFLKTILNECLKDFT